MNHIYIRISGLLIVIWAFLRMGYWAGAATYTDLYNFAGHNIDGISPSGSLIQVGTSLYGLTAMGGPGIGTIFSFNLTNDTESPLYSFESTNPDDGALPHGALIQSGSILYGMTSAGGTDNAGTVFAFNTLNSNESVLYSFGNTAGDGHEPLGSLIQVGSNLYGTTQFNTVFAVNLAVNPPTEGTLHTFMGGPSDGFFPYGSLTPSGSNLYGLTSQGGSSGGYGTIFTYNLSNNSESVLYSFAASPTDGAGPFGSLLQSGSTLYGTTSGGGANRDGTIFGYNTITGVESLLYSFGANANDGTTPVGSLILVGDTLYGTTENGGNSLNDGTVFAFDLSTDTESILHSFQGIDGANPMGDLLAVGDTLYGLAANGGTHADGVIFSVAIPEPASFTLLVAGGLGLLSRRPRR
jgi:uncharacterized repeat protein (TIGR03803 family)